MTEQLSIFPEEQLLLDGLFGQSNLPFVCYQCEKPCSYLFDDGRCKSCTRLTPEEVQGVAVLVTPPLSPMGGTSPSEKVPF